MALESFKSDDKESDGERKISNEELLNDIRIAYGKVDGYLASTEYNEIGEYSHHTARNRFGEWHKALEKAGVISKHNKEATKEDFVSDILRVATIVGKSPTTGDYEEHGYYSLHIMRNRFDDWSHIISEIEDQISNIVMSQMISDVKEVARSQDGIPSLKEYTEKGEYTRYYVRKHFGSWRNLLMIAGFKEPTREEEVNPNSLNEAERKAIAFMLITGHSYEEIQEEFNLADMYDDPESYIEGLEKRYIAQDLRELLDGETDKLYNKEDRSIKWLAEQSNHNIDEILSNFSEAVRDLEKFGDTRLLITLCINLVSEHTT